MRQIIHAGLIFILLVTLSYSGELAPYYRDRGNSGIPTSMFGTYIAKGDFLIYPFYEFYWDHNTEYSPAEFGYGIDEDFEGRSTAHEGLIYIAYGFTEWLMVEFETAVITETLWKADEDGSGMPDSIKESGLGDVEGQIRFRCLEETEKRPELFTLLEVVLPVQKNMDRQLIGTTAWEFKLGVGAVKGFAFGTMGARFAIEYDGEEKELATGEYALEYLRKFTERYKLFSMIEGSEDEAELVIENQIFFTPKINLKLGTGLGITPKATDIAPEVGVMFRI